jgi:hypothetical protein
MEKAYTDIAAASIDIAEWYQRIVELGEIQTVRRLTQA